MRETATMQLFQIHGSFKVNFKVVVVDNSELKKDFPIINKFNYLLNDYLNITPYPYIEIDIRNREDKKNGGNTVKKMTMGKRDTFIFIGRLILLERNLTTDNGLFFYNEDGELKVNNEKATDMSIMYENNSNHLEMRPIVVPTRDSNKVYEGVLVTFGRNWDNYTYLTTDEVRYLLYELRRLDFSSVTLQLINTYLLSKEVESKTLVPKALPPVQEEKEEEIIDEKKSVFIQNKQTIPEI